MTDQGDPAGQDPVWMRRREAGVEVQLRLTPHSSRDRVVGLYGDRLKISLTAPPVGGAANEALQRFLGKTLAVPPTSLRIVRGIRDPSKTVLIETDEVSRLAERVKKVLAALVDKRNGRS